jgi:hypothetical protein
MERSLFGQVPNGYQNCLSSNCNITAEYRFGCNAAGKIKAYEENLNLNLNFVFFSFFLFLFLVYVGSNCRKELSTLLNGIKEFRELAKICVFRVVLGKSIKT